MRTVSATRLSSAERVPDCSSSSSLVQVYHLHSAKMVTREGFRGPRRKAVLAFDVGTTYSGISYSILDPGVVPEIKGVTRFPAHEHITGASKIPTIIYYDRNGKVRAVGAEAMREGIYEQAEDEEWVKAEWFKLHLRSKIAPGAGKQVTNDIPPLPPGKTVVDVFADFLSYLYECAAAYIKDTDVNGAALWDSVEGQIDFVLSHPNGWEGTQQNEMRKAAIQAGLVSDTPTGHARLSFVTEGEASLHYAIQNGLPPAATKARNGVVIVDAGGGTIDVSSYRSISKDTFEEVAVPQCHFNGSVFVNIYAQEFLSNFLEESQFLLDLDHIVRCFDKTTKLRFRDDKEAQYIKFGSMRDNDALYNIRYGQLKLNGASSDVALFFEKSIKCIVQAVISQRNTALRSISHVVLVGGFSASDWVYSKVNEALTPLGLHIIRPDNHVNKAVSDGAISFYLDHFVQSRLAKVTYGTFGSILYDHSDPEHVARKNKSFVTVSGDTRINDAFDVILPKNTKVSETKEFRSSYSRKSESTINLKVATSSIWCYRGNEPNPKWKDVDTDRYTHLCTLNIDLSHLPLSPITNLNSTRVYYDLEFDIVLQFGLTELKAQLAWEENGIEKRSPTKIVYDPDTSDS
ncbi:hypothetical protein D9619_002184 [Psilocybe cf. subviscida]|uniref:Heat shock 70 kDa protein 12A n=1 Tax=Psilocybe cf. subviscida TaxID=2480587 RepID=A0A8H5F346_9AGAR|nr:hypothetical protein D9619_002184 [Psilocybe cf. subviscida]